MEATTEHTCTPPLLVGAAEAAALLSISRTSFLQADRLGTIGPMSVKIGARRLWSVEQLAAWSRWNCPSRQRFLELWRAREEAAA